MKKVREEGHYTIKRVKRLPKRGNQNWLYAFIGDTIPEVYRWSPKKKDYETIKLGSSSGSIIFQPTDLTYDSNTGELICTFADGSVKSVTISTGSSSLSAPSFIVSLPAGENYGKYKTGDIVPAFNTIQEQVKDIGQVPIPQTFDEPSLSVFSNPTNNVSLEIGTTLTVFLSSSFIQNDAGSLVQTKYVKNNIDLPSNSDTIILTESNVSYRANATYQAGTGVKTDVLGNNYPNTILAGNINSSVINFRGYKPVFYGNTPIKYITSTDIRTLDKSLINSSNFFILETGTTNIIFQFWLPTGTSLVSVIHENINDDITTQFLEENLTVNDINGDPMTGKLYTYDVDVAFSQSNQFKITKS